MFLGSADYSFERPRNFILHELVVHLIFLKVHHTCQPVHFELMDKFNLQRVELYRATSNKERGSC
jgi:hypothetical protein